MTTIHLFPTIVVTGFGRCGTTMMMHMLAAGGVPCHGEAPAYEDDVTKGPVPPGFWGEVAGKAVKIIDPHRVGPRQLPPLESRHLVILMTRDPMQQAASHAKLLGVDANREHRRRLAAGLISERPAMRALLRGRKCLHLGFETVLLNPLSAAHEVAIALASPSFNASRAASVVLRRDPQCAPDLSIEARLMREAQHA